MRRTEPIFRMEWTKRKGAIGNAVSRADRSDQAALTAIADGLDLLAEQVMELTGQDDKSERKAGNL